MFQHILLLAYRSFLRFKSTFFINLIGLSTGLAGALLIYLWVSDELSVDKFHAKDRQLYQILENKKQANGIWTDPSTSGLMAETLAEEMPEVEYATAVGDPIQNSILSVQEKNIRANGQYVGPDFFKVFSYEITQGDKKRLLSDKNSILISEALAKKLFNTTQNIIGKAVEFQHEKQFLVSGIFKTVPPNSSQQFDFVLSYELYKEKYPSVLDWGNESASAYVILKPGTNMEQFNKKIADYVKAKTNNNASHRTPFVKPYSEKYLYGKYENGVQTGGRIEYVQLFSIIAIVILVIACINFMNLSTAKASRRLKEVGVKKALGASRKTLIFQYLGESMLLILLSLIAAILLVILLLPHFNQITDKQLALGFNLDIILAVTGISLLTGLIAGSYPALYLSGFNPVTILKGKLPASVGEIWARQGLVVFQFALSVIFIVSVLVVYQQVQLIQTKNLGYDRNNIIWFSKEGKLTEQKALETFLSEIKNLPGVVNASSIRHNMAGHVWGTSGLVWAGKSPEDNTEFEIIPVYYDMLETLGIELKEGRTFSKEYGADSSKVILNEAALALMRYKEPIGKTIQFFGENRQIIGVAKNFHFESLHETIKPLVFIFEPARADRIMVKIQAGREQETLYKLQKFYQEYNPGFVFEYKFLDQAYQTQYVAEKRVGVLSKYFAGLAILISCLGLFGLAAFTAERRRKEISVRKVLGASRFSIVYLLSSDFTKLVVIAICLSLPLSYLLVRNWLQNFEYRIDLQWWYFIGAGLAALVIAWLTVSSQAMKAASVNPAQSLKDE